MGSSDASSGGCEWIGHVGRRDEGDDDGMRHILARVFNESAESIEW